MFDIDLQGADDSLIKIWNCNSGRLFATLRGHSGEVSDLAVSFDNRLLASGSCDRTVRVWSLKTTATIAVLPSHSGMITSVEVSVSVSTCSNLYKISRICLISSDVVLSSTERRLSIPRFNQFRWLRLFLDLQDRHARI